MTRVAQLYGCIQADLERAAAIFRDELQSDQPFIRELCAHIGQFHGKYVRPALLLLTARAVGNLRREHHTLAAVVEMVHIATLVHDDILDEADVRRRVATVNRLWGNERAVLLGDFLISHAYHLCSSLETTFASRLIGRTCNTVCEGEMMQVVNRENFELSEQQYTDIITRKTASLIGACTLLGAHHAGADERTCQRLHDAGLSLGIAFQIADDLLDLTGDESEVGKTLGRDVHKGKLTLPLIHSLRTAGPQQRREMLDLLAAPDCPPGQRLTEMLSATDSLDYALRVAQGYVDSARATLSELPTSDARDALLAMTEFVIARRH